MATLTIILPTLGNPDATEDVKLNNALTAVQAWANGNVDVDNFVNGSLGSAWTSYTPTWTTSGVAPVLGNGTLSGAFIQIGKTVAVRIFLMAGTTTTFGTGIWDFALPFAARGDGTAQTLSGYANPAGALYNALGQIVSGSSFLAAWSQGAQLTLTQPASWVANGSMQLQGTYEAA